MPLSALDQLIQEQQDQYAPSAMSAPAVPQVTVAGVTPLLQGPFGASGTDWAQAKWNQEPYQQFQDLRLDELRTRAARNKFQLENEMVQAPLQDRLLEAKINASGAHQRYLEKQDAEVLDATGNFLSHMAADDAPRPGDPAYHNYVLKGLLNNRRFAETPGGRDMLKKISETHDTNATVAGLQIPEGFDVSSVRTGPKGQSVTMKPAGAKNDVAKRLKADYGLTIGEFQNPANLAVGNVERSGAFKGDDKGDYVRVLKKNGKESVNIPVKVFLEELGGKFSTETMNARGANATVGAGGGQPVLRYNPKTGNLDKP